MTESFDSKPNSSTENEEKLKRKILLADDEKANLFGLTMFLRGEGYEVASVESGQALLDELASGEKFDAVITDNLMILEDGTSGVSGVQALEYIRNNEKFKDLKNLPVIVLSASEIKETVEKLSGVYMAKPVDLNNIQEILEQEIKKSNK